MPSYVVSLVCGNHCNDHDNYSSITVQAILGPLDGAYTSVSIFRSSFMPLISSSQSLVTFYCIDHVITQYPISACYELGHFIYLSNVWSIHYSYHVQIILLLYASIRLCFYSALLYHACLVSFKYWTYYVLNLLVI